MREAIGGTCIHGKPRPHLEVTELHGKCAACDVFFTVGGKEVIASPEAGIAALQEQFRTHFRKVHMLVEASQAAKPRRRCQTGQDVQLVGRQTDTTRRGKGMAKSLGCRFQTAPRLLAAEN
jgi:hypothetical protein